MSGRPTRRPVGLAPHLAILAFAVSVAPARGEPFLAVRTGYKCSVCHVNQTGGGKRTGFGTIYAQTTLPHRIKEVPGGGTVFDPSLGDFASIGGNLRLTSNHVPSPEGDQDAFLISDANLYVQVDMIRDFLTFYVDETIAPGGASNREAFALIRGTPTDVYLKAGRMLLPYGLRLWDDDAFIRRITGFNYASQDVGVELGWQPGPLFTAVAFTNGTQGGSENNRDKQVSAVAEVVFRRFRVGGSFSRNEAPAARRRMAGAFAGVTSGRFTLLGEYDVIEDEDDQGEAQANGNARLAYGELNYLITKGINLKFALDWWDPFSDVEEDERSTVRIGFEPFLTQFLQVRLFYRDYWAPPQLGDANRNVLSLEMHAFF